MKRFAASAVIILLALGLVSLLVSGQSRQEQGPLKVFILAGQSNMEGYGAESSLASLADDPLLTRTNGGQDFPERDDVWVRYGRRKGNLALGYGVAPHGGPGKGRLFGPEYGFGLVLGERYEEQVLLIKCCWGGAALARQPDHDGRRTNDFYPPSAGGETETGPRYQQLVANSRATLQHLKRHFPAYDNDVGYEICGLVWFQGYNDQFGGRHEEYRQNLTHLIRDLRRDLQVPDLPVVIGGLGTGGPNVDPLSPEAAIRRAQQAVASDPAFSGTVTYVATDELTDQTAVQLFNDGSWAVDPARHYAVLSEAPIHYYGSGKMMYRMGHAFGRAMEQLLTR